MSRIENPALKAFTAQIENHFTLAQVVIRRAGGGYDLRHTADTDASAESLRLLRPAEARALAQATASGEFRPLKSAPTLARGWRIAAKDDAELETALAGLYPGAVADWFAARAENPPATNYPEYAGRQSGMFRITAMLSDAAAAEVARSVCAAANCLKRRLWTVPGLAPDAASEKSAVPCLEPCAVLMESARKAVRAEQEKASNQPRN